MLVESLELTDEGPGVLKYRFYFVIDLQDYLEDNSHPVVDVVDHLVVLANNHPEFMGFYLKVKCLIKGCQHIILQKILKKTVRSDKRSWMARNICSLLRL